MSTDILYRIKAGLKNHKIIPFPGTDVQVRMNLLSEADSFDAIAAAEQMFKAKNVEVKFHTVNAFENEKAVQMLYRSLRDSDNVNPLTSSITEFRKLLTSELRTALIEEYNSLSEECNPSPFNLSPDEFDRLVESVKKKSQGNDWEYFKFVNAEKARALFGRGAFELTEGQWTYILIMRMIEKQNLKMAAKEQGGETWTLDLDDDGED